MTEYGSQINRYKYRNIPEGDYHNTNYLPTVSSQSEEGELATVINETIIHKPRQALLLAVSVVWPTDIPPKYAPENKIFGLIDH